MTPLQWILQQKPGRWTDMKRFVTLILCISFLLPGCMVGPDYEQPVVESPNAWRITPKEAADTANTAWWEQFQDSVLNGLINTALLENKDIRIAAARMEQFIAQVGITRASIKNRETRVAASPRRSPIFDSSHFTSGKAAMAIIAPQIIGVMKGLMIS